MNLDDLEYLCRTIGSLAGMPVRIYENGEQVFYYSVVYLPRDPMLVYKDRILQISGHIGYFSTEEFHYYGIVGCGNTKIIVGPSRQTPDSDSELRALAFRADVPADDVDDFISGMKDIIQMPIESTMQMLCTMNFVLNGEKRSLEDIVITDSLQEQHTAAAVKEDAELRPDPGLQKEPPRHNTYDLEQTLLRMIRKGDVAGLNEWLSGAPAVSGGLIAPDALRQLKNTFIVSATLASRAAIRGGLDADDAFTLSDAYIRRCELLADTAQIMNLQYHMILDYTQRVARLRRGAGQTQLTLDVMNYIIRHISEPITTEEIAAALHMSRTHLSRRFSREAGTTLSDCILSEKVEEAKRLLRYTDKSLSAIGLYLGFSSQSHFSRVFRKYAQLSPGEYRTKHSFSGR